MPLSLEEYRVRLVNSILFAASREEVKRFIDAALRGLHQHKISGDALANFIENISVELEQFDPMNKNAQQWSNIKIARVYFYRLKKELEKATA